MYKYLYWVRLDAETTGEMYKIFLINIAKLGGEPVGPGRSFQWVVSSSSNNKENIATACKSGLSSSKDIVHVEEITRTTILQKHQYCMSVIKKIFGKEDYKFPYPNFSDKLS
ncbi:hypothetical protein [Azospirillum brasilense]|uniref:hypothetical protein n=1 Tax=Azospirillum brasilense TaxID=192 RepID=UPI0013B3B8C6|nr:hypothetical protein [Azospirillum brasilense]